MCFEMSCSHLINFFLLSGTYETPAERLSKTASGKHGKIFGAANPEKPDTTGAFFINWNKGQSITAWTGRPVIVVIN